MPAPSKGAPPTEPAPPTETPAAAGVSTSSDPEVPPGRLAPGVYAYTPPFESVYLEVPLTARPAQPDLPAPATVFDWQQGAPADGRWTPTRSKPNQAADNAAPIREV